MLPTIGDTRASCSTLTSQPGLEDRVPKFYQQEVNFRLGQPI